MLCRKNGHGSSPLTPASLPRTAGWVVEQLSRREKGDCRQRGVQPRGARSGVDVIAQGQRSAGRRHRQ